MNKLTIGLAVTGDPLGLDKNTIKAFERFVLQSGHQLKANTNGFFTREEAEKVAEEMMDADVLVIACQSFTWYGECILPFLEGKRRPVCCWAAPEPLKQGTLPFNAMTGLNLFTSVAHSYLRDEEKQIKWLYGDPDSPLFRERFSVTLKAAVALKSVCGKRLALIGGVADGFVNLRFDKRAVERRFNVIIDELDINSIFKRSTEYTDEDLRELKESIRSGAYKFDANEDRFDRSCRVILALRELFEKNSYAGIAVSCWPQFQQEMDIFPCLAFGWLCDHGYPTGCEGDLMGVISTILLSSATHSPSALMDMVQVDPDKERIMWWHCGLGIVSYADSQGYRLSEYFGMPDGPKDPGVVADMVLRPQKATVMRLHDDGDTLFVLSADITGDEEDRGHSGVRGWFGNLHMREEPQSIPAILETIVRAGLPHHYAIAGGDGESALIEAARWLGISVVEPAKYHPYIY